MIDGSTKGTISLPIHGSMLGWSLLNPTNFGPGMAAFNGIEIHVRRKRHIKIISVKVTIKPHSPQDCNFSTLCKNHLLVVSFIAELKISEKDTYVNTAVYNII